MTSPSIQPIVKEVVVGVNAVSAFALFTDRVAQWWPVDLHSVDGSAGQGLRFDERGFVETLSNGRETEWGAIRVWDPPHRLLFTWHPGAAAELHTLLEITFTPAPAGTLVRLAHTGWETLPLPRQSGRANYVTGWDFVLGRYVQLTREAWE